MYGLQQRRVTLLRVIRAIFEEQEALLEKGWAALPGMDRRGRREAAAFRPEAGGAAGLRGLTHSRRTVAQYRKELHLLSFTLRKTIR
ncbi:hypothetical protein ACP26L_27730 [Paenibacillus sp. S-38]|uniref:hypothetical protein n=1 Tax=Paenibacillus sp. S-38 TaxID=3416710 RepID=UPI003CE86A40